MPKVDDVAGLIRAIGDRDYAKAKQFATVMIANERKNNRVAAVAQLERALNTWGESNSKLVELPNNIKPLLSQNSQLKDLSEIRLQSDVEKAVNDFLYERQNGAALKNAGLSLRNKILLAGPPGNGKTTLAGALAKELNLPIYTLKLSEAIDSYMGNTGKKIGQIVEYAMLNRCIVFLDELDAIGRVRGGEADGSSREYSLIVNTLLTCLDRLPDTTVIIGATNMPDLLDPALVRRFNVKLWLDKPDTKAIDDYITAYMDSHAICFPADAGTLGGEPWSKVEEYCLEQHRNIILGRTGDWTSGWIGKAV